MPLSLILETATEVAGILIADSSAVIAWQPLIGGPDLSKTIASHVRNMTQDRQIQKVIVGIGPGSYTGTRVGVALAQALAFGWNVPLHGYVSLSVLTCPEPTNSYAVVVDAKMGGVYVLIPGGTPARWTLEETEKTLAKFERLATPTPSTLRQRLPVFGNKWVQAIIDPAHLASFASDSTHWTSPKPLIL
ncbi:MAG: hypothetical protein RL235_290 [Chlamydiota bacterium]|jgi:tRNA threonylcarbamoyl adenosine modification protein YeaZ